MGSFTPGPTARCWSHLSPDPQLQPIRRRRRRIGGCGSLTKSPTQPICLADRRIVRVAARRLRAPRAGPSLSWRTPKAAAGPAPHPDLPAGRQAEGGGPQGHSPVWVRTWPCSSQGLEKAFPQVPQTQGSVWLRMCILRAPRLRYSLLQYLQLKALRVWESLATESPASCAGNRPRPGKAT